MSELARTARTDVALVGAGVMSATLGALLRRLEPDWSITLIERLDAVAAESMRDDLGAPPLLAKQPLQEIGGADRPAMAEREAQMAMQASKSSSRQVTALGRSRP